MSLRNVWLLTKKDCELFKRQTLAYSSFGLVSIGVMSLPKMYYVGSVLLFTSIIAFYCHLVFTTTIGERKEKNHLFLMTLPVSPSDLSLIKIGSLVTLFLLVWGGLFGLTSAFLLHSPFWPGASLAFYSIGFCLYPAAFSCILATAIISRSEGWTIFVLVITNVIVTVVMNYFPTMPFMKDALGAGDLQTIGILWPEPVNQILSIQWVLCGAVLALAVIVAARQKEFV
jgi:ABC-2 type transport system permease protein